MVVVAVVVPDVQREPAQLGEGLEPFLEQLGVHGAELGLGEGHLPDQVRPVAGVERHFGQRLVHRDLRAAVAADAGAVAQRLHQALAEHDAAVLGGVVDVQLALEVLRFPFPAWLSPAGSLFEGCWPRRAEFHRRNLSR